MTSFSSRAVLPSTMDPFSSRWNARHDPVDREPGTVDAGRDADAVERGAADRQAGDGCHRRPHPRHPLHVPDRVLGQPAAPARDPGVDRLAGDTEQRPELAADEFDEFAVLQLQRARLADAAY